MNLFLRVKRALKAYGPKSNVHGLYHIFRSHDKVQKIFWLIILIAAFVLMIFHMIFSVKRYLDQGIFIHVSDESKDAKFPDVTVCNLRPIVESTLMNPKLYKRFVDHLSTTWDSFLPWIQAITESNISYSEINRKSMRSAWYKLAEIFWASEDTFELSLVGELAILDCLYEKIPCSHTQFKLVRDPDSWSCYSFVANKSKPIGSHGLELVLFTESAFIHENSDDAPLSVYGLKVADLIAGADKDGKFNFYGNYSWLLDFSGTQRYASDGVRVIIHEHQTHPMLSPHQLEFETGVAAIVNINEMIVEKENRYRVSECQQEPYQTIEYVTGFETTERKRSTYYKLLDERLTEETQLKVYRSCQCYSHRYPFRASVDNLCYFVPKQDRRKPTDEHLARIKCHDYALNAANIEHVSWVSKTEFTSFKACETALFTFTTNTFVWPRNEDMEYVVNKYVLNRFLHKSNFSEAQVLNNQSIFGGPNLLSREEAIMQRLFFTDCINKSSDPQLTEKIRERWCLKSNDRLRQNLVKLQIKKWRPKSRLAKENPNFEWPEALSEIGGIFGLWLGFSVITFIELLELAWCIIWPQKEDKDDSDEDKKSRDSSVQISGSLHSDLD